MFFPEPLPSEAWGTRPRGQPAALGEGEGRAERLALGAQVHVALLEPPAEQACALVVALHQLWMVPAVCAPVALLRWLDYADSRLPSFASLASPACRAGGGAGATTGSTCSS